MSTKSGVLQVADRMVLFAKVATSTVAYYFGAYLAWLIQMCVKLQIDLSGSPADRIDSAWSWFYLEASWLTLAAVLQTAVHMLALFFVWDSLRRLSFPMSCVASASAAAFSVLLLTLMELIILGQNSQVDRMIGGAYVTGGLISVAAISCIAIRQFERRWRPKQEAASTPQ